MKAEEIRTFKERLLDMQRDLGRRSATLLAAIQEEEHPTGEHERRQAPSAAAESDRVVEQTEEEIGRQVVQAIERIEFGVYGICSRCGKPISKARLYAVPYAAYCMSCEHDME